ncbi:MAG TPA: type II toxin-antitoxin system VapC family toxin [Candidatus Binataceae bacterium]|nr:type II toxin-antitoxin system VapC family toxin [Candidatus Binataceae bacterium]
MSSDQVVVDASIGLKWAVDEPFSYQARLLLGKWEAALQQMIAPTLFFFEITNALSKRVRNGQLTISDASERLQYLLAVGPVVLPSDATHRPALEMAARFRMTAAYDAHYLALAESHRCEFWTADERLWNSVKRELNWVRWIGEATP